MIPEADRRPAATIDVHLGADALRAIVPLWSELLAASGSANIFLTWEWMSAWCEVLGTAAVPCVLVVRNGDGAVKGLAPLYTDQRAGRSLALRRLRLMGTGFGADHMAFICRAGEDITPEVADWIAGRVPEWDVAELRWVDEVQARRLAIALERYRGHVCVLTEADPSPVVRLPATWEEYRGLLGSSHRASLGRYARKLERERAPVDFRRAATAEEFGRAWSALVRLHQTRWRRRGLPGSFVKPHFEELHRQFARLALERGWLRLYHLEAREQIIAVLYCFRYGPRVSYFQAGFDTAWARYGPGRLLMAHAIRSSIEEGATEFDFMRGVEEHKLRWKPELRHDYHVTIFRARPAVITALRLQGGVRLLRRGARRLLLSRLPRET